MTRTDVLMYAYVITITKNEKGNLVDRKLFYVFSSASVTPYFINKKIKNRCNHAV